MVPSSFRRWHLRDRHSLQPFSEFPLKVRLQTGRERKSHSSRNQWCVSYRPSLCASAVVLRRSAVLGADSCARSFTRAPAPPPVFRVGVVLELKRFDVTNNPSVKLKKRENSFSIWSKCELCFHNSINMGKKDIWFWQSRGDHLSIYSGYSNPFNPIDSIFDHLLFNLMGLIRVTAVNYK